MAELGCPHSTSTVRLRMIDTTAVMVVNAKFFIEPVQKGHEQLNLYVAAFLIEHPPSGRKIMFDLGVRKDYWKLPAGLQKRLGFIIPGLRVDRDATEILEEKGVGLGDISSVIWSHYHWDHTGSMELFPSSTELVVGPGFKTSPILLPGFPHNADSPINAAAIQERKLTEIGDDGFQLEIGGFRAHDFFEDGSFYLLDTPGHCVGHMCGLARTTGGPGSTFVLLGGDICHFPGVFRPYAKTPLPDTIPDGLLDEDGYFPIPCPSSLFEDRHPQRPRNEDREASSIDTKTTPFYRISTDESTAYTDVPAAHTSVHKLVDFDACPSVLVCLAHDETMLKKLPTFNEDPEDDLNDWKQRGYKKKIQWGWLNDLSRSGRTGRPAAVEGFWKDGLPWPEGKEVLRKNGESASKLSL
ncbi:hypothetical protein K402DRAFT_368804 [Aulographum hederae CBS 113979]|uniref:Metallo-beta-lactamase domain-containing protein n=1 Tax=Aulographum hederae CBS 113979 TaxID=1176131 RepID=A0A6G1HCZ5_9PEZI|nr:hypothetical protein K402DRAFT_368804 [Aulographum hederae CBS 113979]